MMQVEVVQYEGDTSPRIRVASEEIGSPVLWKNVPYVISSPPPYNPETQFLERKEGLNQEGTMWVKGWVVKDLPPKPPHNPETQGVIRKGNNWVVVELPPSHKERSLNWGKFVETFENSSLWDTLEDEGGYSLEVSHFFSLARESMYRKKLKKLTKYMVKLGILVKRENEVKELLKTLEDE